MTRRGGWPPSGFGERLRRVREQAGLSQRELAEKAGCNPFTVAKAERGEQEPAWPLVLALARALGVEVGAFVPRGTVAGARNAPQTVPRPRGRPTNRGGGTVSPTVEGQSQAREGEG